MAVMWEGRGWYWPLVMAFFSADMVLPWKGRRPASSSYTITPKLQMSAAPAYGFPARLQRLCKGLGVWLACKAAVPGCRVHGQGLGLEVCPQTKRSQVGHSSTALLSKARAHTHQQHPTLHVRS